MPRTTLPRPVDAEAAFPELAAMRRTAPGCTHGVDFPQCTTVLSVVRCCGRLTIAVCPRAPHHPLGLVTQ